MSPRSRIAPLTLSCVALSCLLTAGPPALAQSQSQGGFLPELFGNLFGGGQPQARPPLREIRPRRIAPLPQTHHAGPVRLTPAHPTRAASRPNGETPLA